jgi:hypothetical protein
MQGSNSRQARDRSFHPRRKDDRFFVLRSTMDYPMTHDVNFRWRTNDPSTSGPKRFEHTLDGVPAICEPVSSRRAMGILYQHFGWPVTPFDPGIP